MHCLALPPERCDILGMQTEQRNRLGVSLFLLGVVGFTVLMTFYAGPRVMAMRHEVENRQILYKCRTVLDANTIEVQLRGWERPNEAPYVRVRIAGLDTPPLTGPEDPDLQAWAEARGISAAHAAVMANSGHRTLLAFIRMQNMVLKLADGSEVDHELPDGSVAHIFVGGTDVAHKQLLQGLAAHDTRIPHQFEELYAAAEAEARAARRGLWSETR